MADETHTQDTQAELMFLLDFTPQDIDQNRGGQLSESQLERLRGRRRASVTVAVLMVMAAAVIASVFIFLGQANGSLVLTIIGVGITLVGAAVTGIFARHWMRLTADIDSGTVQIVSGTLERVLKPINQRNAHYVLRVGDTDIATSKEVFKLIKHNAPYRLYITKYSRVLLAAEQG